MTLGLATLSFRQGKHRTETERLGDLRAEAARILSRLQRGEITEQDAVRMLNELADEG